MELIESDFKKILETAPALDMDESHIVTMIYNILCSV